MAVYVAVVVKTVLGSHFGVGEFTAYFSGWIGCSLGARDHVRTRRMLDRGCSS